ncbi:MAG: hypothetical protein RR794_03365 [Raoultibacter sp.]
MDMKKNISLGSKKPVYPTKRTVNLIEQATPKVNRTVEILLFVAVLIAIAIFAKFLVADPLASAAQSTAQLQEAQAQLGQLKEEAADFSQVSAEHERYVVVGKTDAEQNLADRNQLFDLLGTKIAGAAHLQSVKVSGNTVTLTCLGLALPEVSRLVESLENDERVAYVTVSTTEASDKSQSSATIQMVLRGANQVDAAAGAKDAAGAAGSSGGAGATGAPAGTKAGETNGK